MGTTWTATGCGAEATSIGACVLHDIMRVDIGVNGMYERYEGRLATETRLIRLLLTVLRMSLQKVVLKAEVLY